MYNGKIVEWPPGCNSHGDHLMGWKSRQDLSNRNIYSRGKHEPFLLKIDTYIVYMAYFYSTKYHIFSCFVHGEIRCAIAGDQVMGMRQYVHVIITFFSLISFSGSLTSITKCAYGVFMSKAPLLEMISTHKSSSDFFNAAKSLR